jgi:hypothetical protein
MISTESVDSYIKASVIDLARLQRIHKALTRLARNYVLQINAYFSTDSFYAWILTWMTGSSMLLASISHQSGLAYGSPGFSTTIYVLAYYIRLVYLKYTLWYLLGPLGVMITIVVLNYIGDSLLSRRARAKFNADVSNSRLVGSIIDGWDNLPDIHKYVHRFFWPCVSDRMFRYLRHHNDKYPIPDQIWISQIVANLDWYIRPPKRLFRWIWILAYLRMVTAVTIIVSGVLIMMIAHNPRPTVAILNMYYPLLSLALISNLVYILSCLIQALMPRIPTPLKARILLEKFQPLIDLFGSQPT